MEAELATSRNCQCPRFAGRAACVSEQVLSGGPSVGCRVGGKFSALEHWSQVSRPHGKGLLALAPDPHLSWDMRGRANSLKWWLRGGPGAGLPSVIPIRVSRDNTSCVYLSLLMAPLESGWWQVSYHSPLPGAEEQAALPGGTAAGGLGGRYERGAGSPWPLPDRRS